MISQHEYKNNISNNCYCPNICNSDENMGILTVNIATAQNTITGSTDTSKMTTFEENITAAGVKPSTGGMNNWTK